MSIPLIICPATLPAATLDEQLRCARSAGFNGLSLWQHVITEAGGASALHDAVQAHGLQVDVLESIVGWEGTDQDFNAALTQADTLFEAALALNCKQVALCAIGPARVNQTQLVQRLTALTEKAGSNDITLVMEFLSWGAIPSLYQAAELMQTVDSENLKLLLDIWHWQRTGADIRTLTALPAGSIAHVQLNDAPRLAHSNTQRETMEARRLPGDGDVDFAAILDALSKQTPRFSVEVFNDDLLHLSCNDACHRLYEATSHVLATATKT